MVAFRSAKGDSEHTWHAAFNFLPRGFQLRQGL